MQLNVTKEVNEKLKQMSEKLNMPKAQCINMLVSQWIKENPSKPTT